MKKIIALFFIIHASLLAKTFEVNTQHSFVNFEVDYMKVSVVKGAFESFKGAFDYEGEKLSNVEFEIDVKSINTRDKKRDNHLNRKDFFHSTQFPHISFKGNEVTYSDSMPSSIKGNMTIRGVTKPVRFDLKWKGFHFDPVDKKKKSLFLAATTSINRKDFNVSWNKALDQGGWVVGDKIKIEVIIEANATDARPAFSRFYIKKKEVLPGSTDLGSLKKKTTTENLAPKEKAQPKVVKQVIGQSALDFVIGFILFVLLCVIGFFVKKKMAEFLEQRMGEGKSDLISDLVVYALLFGASIILAPFMGYERYFQ